jgi:PAS domain S-box-containing protein
MDLDQRRAIYNLVKGFIGLLSPDGTLLDANQSALNFIGASLHEVVGAPFWETPWWRNCHKARNALKEAILRGASGEASRFEAQVSGKSGEIIDIDFSLTPIFNDAGNVASLVAEAHDITALKEVENALQESETRLRLAYEAAGMGTWDWNLTNDELHWSEKQFELFGVLKSEEPMHVGRALATIHPNDLERVKKANAASVEGSEPFREEFRVIHGDGEVRWLVGLGCPLNLDEGGKPKSMIGVNYDITDRKNLELKLTQSNLELESRVLKRTRELEQEMHERQKVQNELSHLQRIETIGQLAGGVAHDFNNLLAVIGGNLELAAMQTADERVSNLIHEAQQAVEAGASLNKRLLSFAQKSSLQPEKIVVNNQIERAKQLLKRTLNKNIRLETQLSPDSMEVLADPGELDSAILNLVINACDAMPSGGNLCIATRNRIFNADDIKSLPQAEEIEYVQLSVSDTGTGMSPDVQKKAIVPFFTTKEPGKGSGLGLSSVFGFAAQSGGFGTIESREGHGTTINIYLPRYFLRSIEKMTETAEEGMPLGRGELVLVVEDDTAVLNITRKRLIHLGYEIIEATTAATAIRLLETRENVSLVFSDVRMPGQMSGYDLAGWVFQNRPDIKVLLTSGYNDFADEGSPKTNILNKPYSIGKLAISLRDALMVAKDR